MELPPLVLNVLELEPMPVLLVLVLLTVVLLPLQLLFTLISLQPKFVSNVPLELQHVPPLLPLLDV